MNIEEIMELLDKTTDLTGTLNGIFSEVQDVGQTVSNIKAAYEQRKEWEESGQIDWWKSETERYNAMSKRDDRIMFTIWLILIVITIILCVTGNDIVLRWLHL